MTKEEKKDEMKNRISMALKDPILQQGFEIICKNVVDLETENNKLLDVINNQDVKIADLEKENAELKKEVLEVRQHLELTEREWGKDTVKLYHFKTQLTKAKDLIEDMYDKIPASHSDYYKDVMERARQFIKEIEK